MLASIGESPRPLLFLHVFLDLRVNSQFSIIMLCNAFAGWPGSKVEFALGVSNHGCTSRQAPFQTLGGSWNRISLGVARI